MDVQEVSALTKQGLNAVKVDYHDKDGLVQLLWGVHTVLSFVVVASDPENITQKNLIDASIEAGVKRFCSGRMVHVSMAYLWLQESTLTELKPK
jgi:hypothetical protein